MYLIKANADIISEARDLVIHTFCMRAAKYLSSSPGFTQALKVLEFRGLS